MMVTSKMESAVETDSCSLCRVDKPSAVFANTNIEWLRETECRLSIETAQSNSCEQLRSFGLAAVPVTFQLTEMSKRASRSAGQEDLVALLRSTRCHRVHGS
ncbi:unnamed protein product [Cercospora beticola]|nr:unnamed protein product [Cercospora beticola]